MDAWMMVKKKNSRNKKRKGKEKGIVTR